MAEPRECINIGDALQYFELVIEKLLNCPFGGVARARIFEEDAINELRNVFNQIEEGRCLFQRSSISCKLPGRRKENIGVIGGSTTGIVGDGIAIPEAASVPFTFGTSTGLDLSGVAIDVAGASARFGFSIGENLKEEQKQKLAILKLALEHFIQFQRDLATAMVTIVICEQAIAKIKNTDLDDVKLSPQRKMNVAITQLLADVETLNTRDDDNRSLSGKIHNIMLYAKTMTDLISKIFTAGESSWFEEKIGSAEQNPFDILASSVQKERAEVVSTSPTFFYSFVKKYLTHNEIDESSSRLPVGIGVDNAGNLVHVSEIDIQALSVQNDRAEVVSTYPTSYCSFVEKYLARGNEIDSSFRLPVGISVDDARNVIKAAKNLAREGGNVLKIAKGVSIAGIVLGALGVEVDIGYLGHAIYDLEKKDVELEQLTQALNDLADVMEEINNISVNL